MASNIPARVAEEARQAEEALQQLVAAPPPAPPAGNAPPANDVGGNAQPPPPPPQVPVATPTNAETELQRLHQQLQTEAGRNAALAAEQAELRGRMQAMQDLLSAQQRQQQPVAPPPPPQSLITDEDRKDFGEDMIDFVGRLITERVGGKVDQILHRLAGIEGSLRQTTQQAQTAVRSAEELAAERYFGYLDTNTPGWRVTNDEAGFIDWLQQRDTFARKTKHELLQNAHAELDAETVAEFFKAYWKEKGVAPATPAPNPAPNQQPTQTQSPPVDPASLVAPTPSTSPTPAVNQRAGKTWTQAEIEQVYDDRMKKRISAEDFARLEKEIETAVIEGRVT